MTVKYVISHWGEYNDARPVIDCIAEFPDGVDYYDVEKAIKEMFGKNTEIELPDVIEFELATRAVYMPKQKEE